MSLQKLKELVSIISRNQLVRTQIVGNSLGYKTMLQQFYEGIQRGKIKTDQDAINLFYKGDRKNKGYRSMKAKLERRLITNMLLIDSKNSNLSDMQTTYEECYKNLASSNILLRRGAKQNAIDLAKTTIKKALKYEFTTIIYKLAIILRDYYACHKSDYKDYLFYKNIAQQQFELLTVEEQARAYKNNLYAAHAGQRSNQISIVNHAITYSIELEECMKNYNSYALMLDAFLIICMRYELEQNYPEIIASCERAIQYFLSKGKDIATSKINYKGAIFTFTFKQLVYHTTLKEYTLAETKAIECLDCICEGGTNWFKTLEQYITVCFHTKQYRKSYELLVRAQWHKRYNGMHREDKELWAVYSAYLHYFILSKKLTLTPEEKKRLRIFYYKHFLKQVPTYSKDKHGINVSILILHILFLLHSRQFGAVEQRLHALERYTNRTLSKKETHRSACFIKMLIVLAKAKFHKATAIHNTKALRYELAHPPKDTIQQASSIELVPYEHLWDCALQSTLTQMGYESIL